MTIKNVPAEYRKKPVVVEAVQYTGAQEDVSSVMLLARAGQVTFNHATTPPGLIVHSPVGDIRADVGFWVIRRADGQLYACNADIFGQLYEKIE